VTNLGSTDIRKGQISQITTQSLILQKEIIKYNTTRASPRCHLPSLDTRPPPRPSTQPTHPHHTVIVTSLHAQSYPPSSCPAQDSPVPHAGAHDTSVQARAVHPAHKLEIVYALSQLPSPRALTAVQEGVFIHAHGSDPYDGGVFYHASSVPLYAAFADPSRRSTLAYSLMSRLTRLCPP
jgi:hypothetical protein